MNVVFWTGIKTHLTTKYGGFNWIDISRRTWQYWCNMHNIEFVAFDEPYADINIHRANWQKAIHCWDVLDSRGINADKVFLVDASSMIKWDAPNIFDEIDDRFTAWNDLDNLKWVYESVKGYEQYFNYQLDITKYINSGVIIFNKSHRELFESFKEFYYTNSSMLIELQDQLVRRGTEQTPFNYWLQLNNVDLRLDMPVTWKLTHLHRKEMLDYNRQLNEDRTPFFIKHGYVWFLTGFDKMQRNAFAIDTWNLIKGNYET
jgi:hypothetical protein